MKRRLLLAAVPVSAAIGIGLSFWKIYAFHLIVLAVVSMLAVDALMQGRIKRTSRSRLPLMLYCLISWYMLSALWSIRPDYTASYVVYLALGIVVVFSTIACTSAVDHFRKLVFLLTVVFGIEICIVMAEVLFGVHWPTSTLSPYSVYLGKEAAEDTKFLFSGFGRNPNNVAVTLLLMIPLAVYCLRGWWRYVFSACAIVVIVVSESRASLIGLVMVLLAYLAVSRGAKFILASCATVICSAWILGHGVLSLPVPSSVDRLEEAMVRYLTESEESKAQDSIAIRRTLISQGLDALADTRGFGLGGGGSMAVPEYFGAEPGTKAAMHNFWLELLIDTGIPFFTLFAAWYLYLILRLWRIAVASLDPQIRGIAAGCFLAMVGFTFGVISVSSAIYFLPMWILLGLAISAIELHSSHRSLAAPSVSPVLAGQQ